jgi:hypothetical protein
VRRCGEVTGCRLHRGRSAEGVGGKGVMAGGSGDGARSDRWRAAFGVARDLKRVTHPFRIADSDWQFQKKINGWAHD